MRRRTLPPDDPEILLTLHNLGDCEQALGLPAEALVHFQECLAAAESWPRTIPTVC